MVGSDPTVIIVSGGFDPIHDGHINYLESASKYGFVVVALNSDEWLEKKKDYVFQTWDVRKRILESIRYVTEVVSVNDRDGTICDALRKVKPNYFGNGGDRKVPHPSEHRYCEKHGIVEIFGIGGEKIQSSSELVKAIL